MSDDAIAARLESVKDAGHTRKLLLGAPPLKLALESSFVDLEIKRLPLADHLAALVRRRPGLEDGVVGEAEDLDVADVVPPEGAVPNHHDARPALRVSFIDEVRVRVRKFAAPLQVGLLLLGPDVLHEPERADLRADRGRVFGEGVVQRHRCRGRSRVGSGRLVLAAAECRVVRMRNSSAAVRRALRRQRAVPPASHHQVIARVARITQLVLASSRDDSRPQQLPGSEQPAATAVFSTSALAECWASHNSPAPKRVASSRISE